MHAKPFRVSDLASVSASLTAACVILLIALVATAPRRVTGDALEYITYTANLAQLRAPSPSPADIAAVRRLVQEHGHRTDATMARPPLRGPDGRYALTHFWLYSALVAPVWRLLVPYGADPVLPFALVNLTLLAVAARVLLRRLRPELALLLVAGPILWWVDKAQVEVFVFALGAIALAQVEDRPWWSLALAGVVAAQFPPFAIVLVVLPVALWVRQGELTTRTWAGLAAGALLAAANPAFFLWRTGTISPLSKIGRDLRMPQSIEALGTVLWDPNIGGLFQVPVLVAGLLLAAATVVRRGGLRDLGAGAVTAWVALPVLLLSFTVPNNFDHGGTPGMSRYALILLLLAVPLLRTASELGGPRPRALAWTIAAVTVAWSVVFFRPAVPEQRHVPTRLAAGQWTYLPWLHDPLPEIFAERVQRTEKPAYPAATHNCTKVLLLGGNWPVPCVPSGELPEACAHPGALCYANWTNAGYRIRLAATSTGTFGFHAAERVWPLPQSSRSLASWALAKSGLSCDEISQRLGFLPADCRHALRRVERHGARASATMRGRLRTHRRGLARILRDPERRDRAYEVATELPGPRTSDWLTRFVDLAPPWTLRRLAPGDPEGSVKRVTGTPWTASLEDGRRLLVYIPARPARSRLDLDLPGLWNGALVHADDGSEIGRVAFPPARGRSLSGWTGDPHAPIEVAPSRRDVVLVLFRES